MGVLTDMAKTNDFAGTCLEAISATGEGTFYADMNAGLTNLSGLNMSDGIVAAVANGAAEFGDIVNHVGTLSSQQLADNNAMEAYINNFVGQMYAEGFLTGNTASVQAAFGSEGVTGFVTAAIGTYGMANNGAGHVEAAQAEPIQTQQFNIFNS